MYEFFCTVLLWILYWEIARGQVCSWNPSTASTLTRSVGAPAEFSFESLSSSQNGDLFTWQLDGNDLAVYEYQSTTTEFVKDGPSSSRVTSSSTYVTNSKSEHNLTIIEVTIDDNTKEVTLLREGCSAASEKAEPVTLSVMHGDTSTAYGTDATASPTSNMVVYNETVDFTCNTAIYEEKTFAATFQSDATWSPAQHTCIPKTCSILPSNSLFTDGSTSILAGNSKEVSCSNCSTAASNATGTCVTDDNVVTVTPTLTCTLKSCSELPENSMFEGTTTSVQCGESNTIVCSAGFTGMSGITGTCSTNDGVVTLSQNLTCTKVPTTDSSTTTGAAETCSILPSNSLFTDGSTSISAGNSKEVSCSAGFTGMSGITGTCSTNDGVVTLSQNLTCTESPTTTGAAESNQMKRRTIAIILCGCGIAMIL